MFVIVQNNTWLIGWNCAPRNFDLFVGMMNRIAMDIASAISPSSLLGTDRRTAYANIILPSTSCF